MLHAIKALFVFKSQLLIRVEGFTSGQNSSKFMSAGIGKGTIVREKIFAPKFCFVWEVQERERVDPMPPAHYPPWNVLNRSCFDVVDLTNVCAAGELNLLPETRAVRKIQVFTPVDHGKPEVHFPKLARKIRFSTK